MLLIIHILIVFIFAGLSLLFYNGKGSFLIAGYNTASEKEKAEIDEKKLCRYMGHLMAALAACWMVTASSEVFGKIWLLWLGNGLCLVTVIIGIIYINTGDRIKK